MLGNGLGSPGYDVPLHIGCYHLLAHSGVQRYLEHGIPVAMNSEACGKCSESEKAPAKCGVHNYGFTFPRMATQVLSDVALSAAFDVLCPSSMRRSVPRRRFVIGFSSSCGREVS